MPCTEPDCSYEPRSGGDWKRHLAAVHGWTPLEYLAASAAPARWCNKGGELLPVAYFFANAGDRTWGLKGSCMGCMRGVAHADLAAATVACPDCDRRFLWANNPIFAHLTKDHGHAVADAYAAVGEKHCPQCQTVRPLDRFSQQQDPKSPFFAWCLDCNVDRSVARAQADVRFTWFHQLVVRLAFADRCVACGLSHWDSLDQGLGPLALDHVVPHATGGVLALDNAALLCAPCNTSKGARDFATFIEARFGPGAVAPARERLAHGLARAQAEADRLMPLFARQYGTFTPE